MKPAIPAIRAAVPGRVRRLKWNELVRHGDFVQDGHRGFEPWAGPAGFRADTYVKAIYRNLSRRVVAGKNS